jgi:Zn-dependent M28 family amino/carboxypeptidase
VKSRGALILVILLAIVTGAFFVLKKDAHAEAGQRVPFVKLPAGLAAQFSGEKAYAHVKTLCEMGPRPPASPAYEAALVYVEKDLAANGWTTLRQPFTAATPVGPVTFTNLLARHPAGGGAAIDWSKSLSTVISGHFDTKDIKTFTFLGANDSGSSTGVLLELGRVLATDPTAASSVELVLFDGEEALLPNITMTDGLYGSKSYAHLISKRATWPALGVVLDIVGDSKYPTFYSENEPATPALYAAADAAARQHSMDLKVSEHSIIDDHVPLQNTGLPCFHMIGDFSHMPYWHQAGDTLENISPDGLEKTGRTTLSTLSAQLP